MSKTRHLTLFPRPGCASHVDVYVSAPPAGFRVFISVYTDDAAMYLHPTDDEARELIAALQWALDQRDAVEVAA